MSSAQQSCYPATALTLALAPSPYLSTLLPFYPSTFYRWLFPLLFYP